MMTEQLKLRLVMIFSTMFIVLNTIFIAKEIYWFMIVPVIFLVAVTAFVALDVLVLFIVFLTPLSVILQQNDFGAAISIPTEPLLFGVMLIYLLRLCYAGKLERAIFFHPVTIAILANLIWIFFTCITSTIPDVSWKFLLARFWLVIPFYFVTLQLFKDRKNMERHLWLYIISFSIVIIYTIINQALNNFDDLSAHIAMNPFYNDHTSYGAMQVMYLPPLIFFAFDKNTSANLRVLVFLLIILFITGNILSNTRAAWVGLPVAAGALVIYLFKIRIVPILSALGIMIALFFVYQKDIFMYLESSRHKNVKNMDIGQRLESITNITTDPSNTERLNRWAAAIRMFEEKPFFGWGPGTYQFQYAPFQISSEKTQISTNFGEKGNSHSEYIGPLAETGVIGLLSVLGILVTALLTAGRIIYHTTDKRVKYFAIALALGLITYFVHGTLNNFLDTDKASAPFWGFIGMLVMMDIRERTKKEEATAN